MEVLIHCKNYVTLWTVACQAPLAAGFFSQEYWSELLFSSPGDLPHPGIELTSLMSLALAGGFFATEQSGKAPRPFPTLVH